MHIYEKFATYFLEMSALEGALGGGNQSCSKNPTKIGSIGFSKSDMDLLINKGPCEVFASWEANISANSTSYFN